MNGCAFVRPSRPTIDPDLAFYGMALALDVLELGPANAIAAPPDVIASPSSRDNDADIRPRKTRRRFTSVVEHGLQVEGRAADDLSTSAVAVCCCRRFCAAR